MSDAAPPEKGTLQISIFGAVGKDNGFGDAPAQFEPWSPPRTYTIVLPSGANDRLVSSCPSSSGYGVMRRALKSGPSAT